MQSLYRRYPVGSLLVWTTQTNKAVARGDGPLAPRAVKLLLDGQQRITTLYGIIRGRPPRFFEGNADAFKGLWFNLATETFEFYSPLKMKDDPSWIDVSNLMREGAGPFIARITANSAYARDLGTYIGRINAIHDIKQIDFHVDDITGEDKTVDLVVDIFNRVNSGGTKLSKGDLALAKICAEWPQAREELKQGLARWSSAGFDFKLELLLRCITAILTGQALFEKLADIDTPLFQGDLQKAENAVDVLLDLIGSRLGLDFDRVLGSRSSLPLMARYLVARNFKLDPVKETGQLLFWNVHSFLWGRYASATETTLNRDLSLIQQPDGSLDHLIGGLRVSRRDLRVHPGDFVGWSQGARFYPLMYMLTRVCSARDWGTGLPLKAHALNKMARLELHHIFPKVLLYKHGYERGDVNALANFTFQTKQTNLVLSDRNPAEYLHTVESQFPDALASHWVPSDVGLWRIERYRDFLEARRGQLASAANAFLEQLYGAPLPVALPAVQDGAGVPLPGGFADPEEEALLREVHEWVQSRGLPAGELAYELCDSETGAPIAVFDLAWPEGLQPGLSRPVALLIDEDDKVHEAANQAGFLFFTDVEAFRRYASGRLAA